MFLPVAYIFIQGTLGTNFKDFPAPTAIFKDLHLNFYFEIQGLSRAFKECVNPVI